MLDANIFTEKGLETLPELERASKVAVPAFSATISPVSLTDAMSGVRFSHFNFLSVALCGSTFAFSMPFSPSSN